MSDEYIALTSLFLFPNVLLGDTAGHSYTANRAVPSTPVFLSSSTRQKEKCADFYAHLFLNFHLGCEFLESQPYLIRISVAFLALFGSITSNRCFT